MKIATSCDEVFDILTRAPFPSGGAEDAAVELHLAACHECRQLAEALRPATDLFHEALQEECPRLPVYRGQVGAVVRRTADNPAAPNWLALAVVAAGLLCASVLVFRGPAGPEWAGASAVPRATIVESWVALLDELRLPLACREAGQQPAAGALTQQCCTRCHHVDSEVAAARQAIAKTVAACLICHDERQSNLRGYGPLDDESQGYPLLDLLDLLVPEPDAGPLVQRYPDFQQLELGRCADAHVKSVMACSEAPGQQALMAGPSRRNLQLSSIKVSPSGKLRVDVCGGRQPRARHQRPAANELWDPCGRSFAPQPCRC